MEPIMAIDPTALREESSLSWAAPWSPRRVDQERSPWL